METALGISSLLCRALGKVAALRGCPIFYFQVADSSELARVVGDQGQIQTKCVSRDEKMVRADQGAALLEVSSDLSVMKRRLIGKIKNFYVAQERAQGPFLLLPLRRHLNAIPEFRLAYDGYAYVRDGDLFAGDLRGRRSIAS